MAQQLKFVLLALLSSLCLHHTSKHSCSVTTEDGGCCKFPFRYKGKLRYSCTAAAPRSRPWCVIKGRRPSQARNWGYCTAVSCPMIKTKDYDCCVFPFEFEGKTYHSCITVADTYGRAWCSLTSNYDMDEKWGYCSECVIYFNMSRCDFNSPKFTCNLTTTETTCDQLMGEFPGECCSVVKGNEMFCLNISRIKGNPNCEELMDDAYDNTTTRPPACPKREPNAHISDITEPQCISGSPFSVIRDTFTEFMCMDACYRNSWCRAYKFDSKETTCKLLHEYVADTNCLEANGKVLNREIYRMNFLGVLPGKTQSIESKCEDYTSLKK